MEERRKKKRLLSSVASIMNRYAILMFLVPSLLKWWTNLGKKNFRKKTSKSLFLSFFLSFYLALQLHDRVLKISL